VSSDHTTDQRDPSADYVHVVSVSSGLGSAFAWKLLCDRYGPRNVVGVFTDVNGEHPDNYRFLAETQYAIGSRLVKVTNDGKTIWDVMIENRYLANTRVDVCSRVLKREAMLKWLKANCDPATATVYLGIDWTEEHRFQRAKPRWAKDGGWNIEAPLCEPPYLLKSDAQAWLDFEGIRRPHLYDLGFSHANCGGGCVKAGIGQFKLLLAADRRWYVNWWEAGEEYVRSFLGKDVAILRDRTGGKTRPLTLRELRERVEADPQCGIVGDDEMGGCGCFTDFDDEAAA
jgi:3'-phosphoadenosine 5'-phosphosulfate sulfotransferase (PAPS reductase)/FAD synthetase